MTRTAGPLFLLLAVSATAPAQISLGSAVGLAAGKDPRVQAAAAEVIRARASLSESKDAFVPVVTTQGGVGKSAGVPLGLPIIFSMQAQSLAFNWSQRDFIRAAHLGWDSSQLALEQAKLDDAEDVVQTYLELDLAEQRRAAAQDGVDHGTRLVDIAQQRFAAGTDAHIEIPRADLRLNQMRQQLSHIEVDIAALQLHLEHLTGLPEGSFQIDHASIPALPSTETLTAATTVAPPLSAGVRAAFVNADSKLEVARGDARYLYRPQVSFEAAYSRITTDFSNYALYYPGFNPERHPDISYNALSIGVQINLPILDQAHRAKARQSLAEANKARFDAESQKNAFLEGRMRLRRAATDLEMNARIAQDQVDITGDELEATLVQLNAGSSPQAGQQPVTPEDEQKSRIGIAQRRLELLDAQLQLLKDKISLMRQNGMLGDWLRGALASH